MLKCGFTIHYGNAVNPKLLEDPVDTVYTFKDSAWRTRALMPQALATHAAVGVDYSTAIVCGGKNRGNQVQSACYLYRVKTNSWLAMPAMNAARYAHGMTVYNGMPCNVCHY